jgi:hypothetical protein
MATTKVARSQPETHEQGAKKPAAHPSVRIEPLRGELPLSERYAAGKALRTELPLKAHGDWSRGPAHPGPVELVMRGNEGRQPQLVPLRLARMIASPFAFYRGADSVMAIPGKPSCAHTSRFFDAQIRRGSRRGICIKTASRA